MEYLKELVHIVTKSRLQKIELISLTTGKKDTKNAYADFYLALQKGKNTPESDIVNELGWDESSSNYRMFKSRFLKRLLNALLFLDPGRKDKNAYRVNFYNCLRNRFSINVLLFLSARSAAVHLARKTLLLANANEITEISAFCARVLRSDAALRGNLKEFEEYHRRHSYYTKVFAAEDKAREEYERISIHYANSTSIKPEFAPQAIKSARTVKRLRLKYPTYNLYIYYYRLQGLADYISRDYNSAVLVWNRFERYLKKRKGFESNMRLAEAALNRMACYLHLRNFEEGKKCAIECKSLMEAGKNNWFYFMEYYFLLSMHSKEYKNAAKILLEVTENPRYDFLNDIRKEKWRIFTAYCWLAHTMFLGGKEDKQNQPNFRINKFMNETPLYAKDKCGYNIAILIIQFIYALNNRNYTQLIDKAGALKQYNERYLKKDTTYHARIFIKMLLSIIDVNFQKAEAEKIGKKYLNILSALPAVYSGNMDAMEIIPFENLWEEVLGILENNCEKVK
jgi:hypothetical protein